LSGLAGRIRQQAQQQLRLAASPNVLREHMPGLLKQLQRETPGLRLTLRDGNQAAAERMLRDDEIDLGVALLEKKPTPGLRHEVLIKLPMVLLVEAASTHQSAAEVIRAASTQNLSLIALPSREQMCTLFHQELARRGMQWPVRIETSDVGLIEAYVAHGFGIGLSLEVPGTPLSPRVRALRLRGFPQLVFGALWRSQLPVLAERFLELARLRARELQGA
jgi:DNA-binding transcriptional LysR family regulator